MKFPWKRGGGADDEDQVSKLLYIIKNIYFLRFSKEKVRASHGRNAVWLFCKKIPLFKKKSQNFALKHLPQLYPEEPVSASDYYHHPTAGMTPQEKKQWERENKKAQKKKKKKGEEHGGGHPLAMDEERRLFPEIHEYRKEKSELVVFLK